MRRTAFAFVARTNPRFLSPGSGPAADAAIGEKGSQSRSELSRVAKQKAEGRPREIEACSADAPARIAASHVVTGKHAAHAIRQHLAGPTPRGPGELHAAGRPSVSRSTGNRPQLTIQLPDCFPLQDQLL